MDAPFGELIALKAGYGLYAFAKYIRNEHHKDPHGETYQPWLKLLISLPHPIFCW